MYGFRRHWMRHTAAVPKGFLRYQVLEILSEKSMSGSEIMKEIETRTEGYWKPSPGSIYPLLAWLQDNGHVKELLSDQMGMKRYELTASGKTLLTEQKKIIEEQRKTQTHFRKKGIFIGLPFVGAVGFHLSAEENVRLRQSLKELRISFLELTRSIKEKDLEWVVNEVTKVVDETTQKLDEINKRLKEQ